MNQTQTGALLMTRDYGETAMPKFFLYRPTALEIIVVVIEMAFMALFAWSFTVSQPSEAFVELATAWGVAAPGDLLTLMGISCAILSPFALAFNSRGWQIGWYGACVGPLVFYSLAVGYYRWQVLPGNWTGIIVYLFFAVVFAALGAATFRDPKVRRRWRTE